MEHDRNYDYAHVVFAECVQHDPSNLAFVEALLKNLRAKVPQRAKTWGISIRHGVDRTLKKALVQRDWKRALQTGVDLLKSDPWNVSTLRAMAEACAALHYNEVELAFLKQALEAAPKNVDVNRHCGHSLARMGQFDQAIACWHRVEKLAQGDKEAARMVAFLYEEKLRYPGGRPPMAPAASERPAAASPAENNPANTSTAEVTLTPRQRLERAVLADPANADNYIELAQLLSESAQFAQAEAILNRGLSACGEQAAISAELQRIIALRAEHAHSKVESRKAERAETEKRALQVPWLELVIVLAICALILQLSPTLANATLELVDPRNWSRWAWFFVNAAVLMILVGVRFGSTLLHQWRRN